MLFTSSIFIYIFLPFVIIINSLIRKKYRNTFLLLTSLFFYAWGEPVFVLFMIASITANYCFGIAIAQSNLRKTVLGTAITFNLGLLVFFKYSNFVVENINAVLAWRSLGEIDFQHIALPIGISFFTFQAMSYVIDIYRKEATAQKNLFDIGLYISLFPQLIAGPIVRYHDIARQIKERTISYDDTAYGIKRFIIGFAKKMIIANNMGFVADKIFLLETSNLTFLLGWLGAICYALQIYYDFSGYSDMAIGLGRIFGFHIRENFNYPYISKSIREFWRRWHISLSTWFRDYLYIPLGGNRSGRIKMYRNLLIVFSLCGLWHGASWNFVVWGLFHGLFLILERTAFGAYLDRIWRPLRHMYALFIVLIGWVFFRADNMVHAAGYIKSMFGMGQATAGHSPSMFLVNESPIILIIAIIGMTPVVPKLVESLKQYSMTRHAVSFGHVAHLVIFYLSITYLLTSSYNPFIYFRF